MNLTPRFWPLMSGDWLKKILFVLISVLLIISNASALVNPNTDINWSKTITGGSTWTTTIQAEQITSTDDITATDRMNAGTAVVSGGSFLNATTVAGATALSVNASTILSTTLTSASTKTVYGIDASGANKTLTLPDAGTVTGRFYFIGTNKDPGSYYVKITATGGDKIGGAGGFTIAQTTDAAAGMLLVSDGTLYLLCGSYGTWAEGTA